MMKKEERQRIRSTDVTDVTDFRKKALRLRSKGKKKDSEFRKKVLTFDFQCPISDARFPILNLSCNFHKIRGK